MADPPLERRVEALEALAREFIGSQSRQDATQAAMADVLKQLSKDARETRDGVLNITTILSEQKFGERIAQEEAARKALEVQMRNDIVNAAANSERKFVGLFEQVNKEVEGLDDRTATLEADKSQREGGSLILKLIKDWASLLVAVGAASIAAWTALGGHIP